MQSMSLKVSGPSTSTESCWPSFSNSQWYKPPPAKRKRTRQAAKIVRRLRSRVTREEFRRRDHRERARWTERLRDYVACDRLAKAQARVEARRDHVDQDFFVDDLDARFGILDTLHSRARYRPSVDQDARLPWSHNESDLA